MHDFCLPSPGIPPSLSRQVLGCAIAVHRELGPGLLENTYRCCLLEEFRDAGLSFRSEAPIALLYKGRQLDCGFRADIIVENSVLLELKAVESLLPIHEAQILTYLKLSKLRVGFLLNFSASPLKNGIRRFAR